MSEVIGNVSGEDNVLNEVQDGFVVVRAEVLKDVAAFSVEDAQSLSEVMALQRERGGGKSGRRGGRKSRRERERGREEGGGEGGRKRRV